MPAASAGSALVIAPTTLSASGSISAVQAGRVCSTHSTRDQASGRSMPDGSSVTWSSQRSASRSASATAVRSAVGRRLVAGGQLADRALPGEVPVTGPPDQVISFCSSANSGILPSRSSGVPAPRPTPPNSAPRPKGSAPAWLPSSSGSRARGRGRGARSRTARRSCIHGRRVIFPPESRPLTAACSGPAASSECQGAAQVRA